MDEGGRGGNTKKGVIINVNGLKSRKLLQFVIQKNYGIQWTLRTLHKNGPLYVPVKS